MAPQPDTIQLDKTTVIMARGSAAGRQVNEAHKDSPFPDYATRLAFYWFYVGGLAVEQGLKEADEFGLFILGAQTAAPERPHTHDPYRTGDHLYTGEHLRDHLVSDHGEDADTLASLTDHELLRAHYPHHRGQ